MIFIPNELIKKKLSPSAFKINICMRSKGPNFSWKIHDIVLLSGLSERTVRSELKNMVKENLITYVTVTAPSGNRINLYKCVYESRTTNTKNSKRRSAYSAKREQYSCAGENS